MQKGWLAIKPPQGSFSWINEKFIKQTDARTGVVVNEGGAGSGPEVFGGQQGTDTRRGMG